MAKIPPIIFIFTATMMLGLIGGCQNVKDPPKIAVGDPVANVASTEETITIESLKLRESDFKLIESLIQNRIDYGSFHEQRSYDSK